MSAGPPPGVVIGVDVGGTKVLAGIVEADGGVRRTVRRETPGRRVDPAMIEDALTDAVVALAAGEPIAAVGLAAAGFVDHTRSKVMFAPHLPWVNDPVRDRLARRWGTTVVLDNDATCATVAEHTRGAGVGARSMVLVTLGTGIGGGLVIAGEVVRGANGMAGEFGHMQVVPDGHPCECGLRGCWEQYSSGNALVRFARSRVGHEPTLLTDLCNGEPARLTGPMVTAAAEQGDLVARAAFTTVGQWLGVGLAGLVAAVDPEVVVVGGGVSAAGDRLLEPAREALARSLVGAAHRRLPTVVSATFGPEAGVVGAGLLARQSCAPSSHGSRG